MRYEAGRTEEEYDQVVLKMQDARLGLGGGKDSTEIFDMPLHAEQAEVPILVEH
jgi:hypothetical protein